MDVIKFGDCLNINIYLDGEYQFQQKVSPSSKVCDLKLIILHKLSIYSVNYKILYQERDYSSFDSFLLKEIFLIPKDEFDVHLKTLHSIKIDQSQSYFFTPIEGEETILAFNIDTKTITKLSPEKSEGVSLNKFPFNSRHCNVKKNRLVITGGINFDDGCVLYDNGLNLLYDLPSMKHKRQLHSMISIDDDRVLVIGGDDCKKVSCLNLEYEDWDDYPDLNTNRKDPSVIVLNKSIIYVFMGSNSSGALNSFEFMDVEDKYSPWKVGTFPNYFSELRIPKSMAGVIPYKEGVLIIGGHVMNKSDDYVVYFDFESFRYTKIKLPEPTCFSEKKFCSLDGINYYLFTFATYKLVEFNSTKESFNMIYK